tara:strand:+ start:20280 stop:20504 length:225 start_codon:yes stop_codon:yes gene_type:complete
MSYRFLKTVNLFELPQIQSLFSSYGIKFRVKDFYNNNLIAGWVDPFCANNERNLYVQEKDLNKAREIINKLYKN